MAFIYKEEARYAEAEPLYRRSLAIREQILGSEHPEVAEGLNSLAALLEEQGHLDDAEPLYERALAIRQKALGTDNPNTAMSLNNLALLYKREARYDEVEPLLKRALGIWESASGYELYVGIGLNNLAALFDEEGRYGEAEPLMKRAVELLEKVRPGHPDLAAGLSNLGNLLREEGRYNEVASYMQLANGILEKALGAEHPRVAVALNNLGQLYRHQRRHADAEPLMKRAVAIFEKALGSTHPDVATALNNLAFLYDQDGVHFLVAPLLLRSLLIRKELLGPEHPGVALAYNNLAEHYRLEGSDDLALDMARRAVEILADRAARDASAQESGALSERQSERPIFLELVRVLAATASNDPAQADEAFQAAQLAGGIETARALSGMAARFEAGGGMLGELVRQRQDLQKQWQSLDAALIKAEGASPDRRDLVSKAQRRSDLAQVDRQITTVGARLRSEFPRYAELASVQPITIEDVQKLLAPDEALVMWTFADEESYLFAIRRDGVVFSRIELTASDLQRTVAHLRQGLEPPESLTRFEDLPRFDAEAAYKLYRSLLAPTEALLASARRLIVVSDGALQSLPLSVLVTKPPTATVQGLAAYKRTPWLARRYALTVLPAASSLRALRVFAEKTHASKPFSGFGDPAFDGVGTTRGIHLAQLFRGGKVDVSLLRRLPRLPETADELRELARMLHAPKSSIHLGVDASVAEVLGTDLSDVRVIAFATHGLVAGDLPGLAEPTLALTPPAEPTPEDDGLLTASRVATLKLNADWVVLSACNTAAPDGSVGAEGLSGLAKAFFYAGARSLLVSHWSVYSITGAFELITGAFHTLETTPRIGRAEALRRSMTAMIDKAGMQSNTDYYAHPMFWAPFSVVGD